MATIQFTGNVGKDSELRHTQNGSAMLTFSVAESKSRKLDDGSWEKLREQWFNVTLFGPAGEALQPFILKGARVAVAGEFWRRDYETQQGNGVSLDVRAVGVDIIKQAQQSSSSAVPPTSGGGWGAAPQGDVWAGGQPSTSNPNWENIANDPPF